MKTLSKHLNSGKKLSIKTRIYATACVGVYYLNSLNTPTKEIEEYTFLYLNDEKPALIASELQPLRESEVAAFWAGMIGMAETHSSPRALDILQFSELADLSSLSFGLIKPSEETLRACLHSVLVKKAHQDVRDKLFIKYTKVDKLLKHSLRDMVEVFQPSERCVIGLQDASLKGKVKDMRTILQWESSIRTQEIGEQTVYAPLIERKPSEHESLYLFYSFFP